MAGLGVEGDGDAGRPRQRFRLVDTVSWSASSQAASAQDLLQTLTAEEALRRSSILPPSAWKQEWSVLRRQSILTCILVLRRQSVLTYGLLLRRQSVRLGRYVPRIRQWSSASQITARTRARAVHALLSMRMAFTPDMCLTLSWWHGFCRAPDEAPGSPPAPGRLAEVEAPEQPGRPSEPAAHQAQRHQAVQQRRRLAPHFERQVDAYHQLFDVYDVKEVYAAGQPDHSSSGCAVCVAPAVLQLIVAAAPCLESDWRCIIWHRPSVT